MDEREGMWLDAAAGLQSEVDADLRAEALEVYRAEAARSRLGDRHGWAVVTLRSGQVITGELGAPGGAAAWWGIPDGFLGMRDDRGRVLLVRADAVVKVSGSVVGLRDEGEVATSLASRLRQCWAADENARALLADGRWVSGRVALVGADYVELQLPQETIAVPFTAVEAWDLGDG